MKKTNGRYIFYCTECNHEWYSKQFEYVCPQCRSLILDFESV